MFVVLVCKFLLQISFAFLRFLSAGCAGAFSAAPDLHSRSSGYLPVQKNALLGKGVLFSYFKLRIILRPPPAER
jgi:hypothetical protein